MALLALLPLTACFRTSHCGGRYADLQRSVDLRQRQCELRWQYLAAEVGWPPGLISKAMKCLGGCLGAAALLRGALRATWEWLGCIFNSSQKQAVVPCAALVLDDVAEPPWSKLACLHWSLGKTQKPPPPLPPGA